MALYLCSFANLSFSPSAYRFHKQAQSMNLFQEIMIYNETQLNSAFKEHFQDKFYTHDKNQNALKPTPGFGYWCWKPQVILQSLEKIQENDILIYADIGCEFFPQYADKLRVAMDLLQESNVVCFELVGHKERQWTKGDIFKHFGVLDNAEYTDTWQIKGGVSFIKKTQKSIEIIQEWLDVFSNHFELVADSKSITPNYPEFKANRHDQSIFSILMKKHKCKIVEDYHNRAEMYGITDSRRKEVLPDWGVGTEWEIASSWIQRGIRYFGILGKIGFTKRIRRKYKAVAWQLQYIIKQKLELI